VRSEDAPEQEGPASDEEEDGGEKRAWHPMPVADPQMEFVLTEVGNQGQEVVGVVVQSAAGDQPAHVRPESAVLRGVRVAWLVGVPMMHAMDADPEDGTALEGEGSTDGEKILHPLGSFVATVGEQAVISPCRCLRLRQSTRGRWRRREPSR